MKIEKGFTIQFSHGEYADECTSDICDVIKPFDNKEIATKMKTEGFKSNYPLDYLIQHGYVIPRKSHVHFYLGAYDGDSSEFDNL